MDDGRCPDGEWARSSKALQATSAAHLAAAQKKDSDAAKTAFADLTRQSCKVCHAAHNGKSSKRFFHSVPGQSVFFE